MSKQEIDQLVLSFLERGGRVKICRAGRKNALNSSWNFIRADVAYRGSKCRALRQMGYAKATGC